MATKWIAINKRTGMHYGPFSQEYKDSMLASVETKFVYIWKEDTTGKMVEPTDEMKTAVKPAKKYNLAED